MASRGDALLDGLNSPQRAAVTTLSGPLLVLAGAGTGKTKVVTHRIANLIRHRTRADRILAVTFTNKAAGEMKRRVGELLGKRTKVTPVVSTFHSYCVQILRRHITQLGYPERFTIYDRGDQESVARGVLREIKVSDAALRPGDLLWLIGTWKSRGIRPQQAVTVASTDKEHLAAVAFRRYQKTLKTAGAVDFDDLLLLTEELFNSHAKVRGEEAGRFDHLLIDEYQDTNGTQYRIVRALAAGHRNLCVVGDDDQSIYGWRGAEVEHILRFDRDWPDAKVVRLEENYRSTAEIIKAANRLIAFNKTRHDKTLSPAREIGQRPQIWQADDEEEEARQVVEDIARQLKESSARLSDFAILFRTNEQPRLFEQQLRKARLPYVLVGGQSFFDRREVRDMLAYMKVLDSPQDEVSLRRIINNPPRGIGQRAVQLLLDRAVDQGTSLWQVISTRKLLEGLPPKTIAALDNFAGLIHGLRARLKQKSESLVDVANSLIRDIGYEAELARLYDDENERTARWAAVEQVVSALGSYEQNQRRASLSGFLSDIALSQRDFDQDSEKTDRNAVTLMTLHAAKGLQFAHVYLVGLEEGLLPHHRSVAADGDSIEEERRLCYVGLTRAEDRLTLSMALTRMKWGKPRPSDPSRFLFEVTGQADNPHQTAPPRGKKMSKWR